MDSQGGRRTLARLRRRAIASKAPWQRWHSRRSWQCDFCKLQTLRGLTGSESHPLRHTKALAKTSNSLEIAQRAGINRGEEESRHRRGAEGCAQERRGDGGSQVRVKAGRLTAKDLRASASSLRRRLISSKSHLKDVSDQLQIAFSQEELVSSRSFSIWIPSLCSVKWMIFLNGVLTFFEAPLKTNRLFVMYNTPESS